MNHRQEFRTVRELYEWLIDDRSHGHDDIADAAHKLWDCMTYWQRNSIDEADIIAFDEAVQRLALEG